MRKEELSQRFVDLTTLVPGLRKMDKASILEDAIEYMEQLQDKVKILEKQSKNKNMKSGAKDDIVTETLPEIAVRFSNKDVLVSIHCERRKGMLQKTLAEIEKLHFSVVSSNMSSFGDSSLVITVIAQKEEFNMNMKEVVNELRSALRKII